MSFDFYIRLSIGCEMVYNNIRIIIKTSGSYMLTYEKNNLNSLRLKSVQKYFGMPHIESNVSPFRYPGGKGKLSKFLALFIIVNDLQGCKMVEPFCGGAGGTLPLLFSGLISKLVLNDINPAVYSFWSVVKNDPDSLIKMIETETVNIDAWKFWRSVYFSEKNTTALEKAFSAFFLNRTNRSGILHAGPIGGQDQSGDYDISCRFNRQALIKKIEKISSFSDKLVVKNKDATTAISRLSNDDFIYADPPYVQEGKNIYNSFCFSKDEHVKFAKAIKRNKAHWLLSYDDNVLIHDLYSKSGINIVELSYVINKAKIGRELLIASSELRQPEFPKEDKVLLDLLHESSAL